MLLESVKDHFSDGKEKVEWEKQIEKGSKVAANAYMQAIVKDTISMHRILSNLLP